MRLKEIKLAGFKSFVDPTHVPIPGRIVGVVGPNGCGKSNVIDAVRWVLGESSARHLRGESMQDVIFNGAGERKPGNRASVELVFDNDLGKVSGEWSKYGEIAIKRILEREGQSEYYINGIHVRRRDISDLFLGTGVGARAYGIIEQGMISQIVEAKPEELRVFLEEAAGVSKYRERRRETELRVRDTRDNLQRVTDIREELEKQLQHLQGQAEVAVRYRELQAALNNTHQLLWFVRKQEASAQRARLNRDLERAEVDLEAEIARLREAERRGEELRVQFYAASDLVSTAQGEFFQASAEVARLEQQLQFLRTSRSRTESQAVQVEGEFEQCVSQLQRSHGNARELRAEREEIEIRVRELAGKVAADAGRLPQAEEEFRHAQQTLRELHDRRARIDQQVQLQDARREHAEKLLLQLDARALRLEHERAALVIPDDQALSGTRVERDTCEAELQQLRARLDAHRAQLPQSEQAARAARQAVDAASARITALDARRSALDALQARLARGENIKTWLAQHGLEGHRRLWQGLRIEQGWDDALEAVLGVRLNALAVPHLQADQSWWREGPPAKLAIFGAGSDVARVARESWRGCRTLASFVTCLDAAVAIVLDEWLDCVFVADSVAAALDLRRLAGAGVTLVTREGHLFTRHSVSFHAPDNELHGVLSRQREIEQIGAEIVAEQAVLADRRRAAEECAGALSALREAIGVVRGQIDLTQQKAHALALEIVRMSEQADRASQRSAQIAAELQEIAGLKDHEVGQRESARGEVEHLCQGREDLDVELRAADAAFRRAEHDVVVQRRALQEAEKALQSAQFDERTRTQRIEDLESALSALEERRARLAQTRAELEADLARLDETELAAQLRDILDVRADKERVLTEVRDDQQGLEGELRGVEQERMAVEQRIEPLRTRINDVRLKEQEARLTEEQFERQLVDAGADEEALRGQLERGVRSNHLNAEITRLGTQIDALGAVNLAALEELSAARERKTYLDSQSADLEEALETLQNAIRRIDRETRELLSDTFEAVNRHFGELFPALFGGGTARLVLTGEEILDAGIQVVAQPPGKRNSSIHLLSGGEKALTAMALIFSMFQLNPAPFCLLDEVDAPLDDSNTVRFCNLVKKMSAQTQFMFISHNKLTMEIAEQLIGVTMQELGVSRIVSVDIEEALKLTEQQAA